MVMEHVQRGVLQLYNMLTHMIHSHAHSLPYMGKIHSCFALAW